MQSSDESTDIWSFGITCWEIYSNGKQPYSNLSNFNFTRYIVPLFKNTNINVLEKLLKKNESSEVEIPENISRIMTKCLNLNPAQKYTFNNKR